MAKVNIYPSGANFRKVYDALYTFLCDNYPDATLNHLRYDITVTVPGADEQGFIDELVEAGVYDPIDTMAELED